MARRAYVLFVLGVLPWLPLASAGEPPMLRDMPGAQPEGRLRARWLAPNVRHVETTLGKKNTSKITWYGADGATTRDVEGPVGPGFVAVMGKERTTYHATRADWTVTLPNVPQGADAYVHAVGPRIFVRETSNAEAQLRVEVFVDGEREAALGPFPSYRGANLRSNEDGSLAFLIRGESKSAPPRVAAFAPGGRATFDVGCERHAHIVTVAPGGLGVLIQTEGGESISGTSKTGTWSWATKAGVTPTPKLGNNAFVVAWVPGTSRALVTSTDAKGRVAFQLVDFSKNTIVWTASDPAPRTAHRPQDQMAIEAGYVLLSGIESQAGESANSWHRSIYALDLATGKPVASWRPNMYIEAPGYRPLRFMRSSGSLYLVSDEQFVSFPLADMKARGNGWRAEG